MLEVLSSDQIKQLDRITIEKEPISSIDLMERASTAFVNQLQKKYKLSTVVVVCGPGNNGGDGLAVARILAKDTTEVNVYIPDSSACSEDFKTNLKRLSSTKVRINKLEDLTVDRMNDLVVDALFGTGLSRQVEGRYAECIAQINASPATVISIDLPSGMPHEPDWELRDNNCVKADRVYTFQHPKLSLLLPYSRSFARSFEVLDIGLVPYKGQCDHFLVEASDIRSKIQEVDRFAHKYSKGAALLCGGSVGKAGSIVLSAEAAFRSGCGVLTVHLPQSVVEPLLQHLPEAMYSVSGKNSLEHFTKDLSRIDAIGIGPGMGLHAAQATVLEQALECGKPLVADADALRLLASFDLKSKLPKGTILTPHEGEFKGLVGEWTSDLQKLELLRTFSAEHEVVTVLKGAHTVVCDGKNFFFNSTGNPAMATAGAGDVLLGVITALRASGYDAFKASLVGVYLHGLAGDLYLLETKSNTLISSDITSFLGRALSKATDQM